MKLLTTREVAELFRVGPGTVIRWANQGMLPVIRLPSGRLRYPADGIHSLFTTPARNAEPDQRRRGEPNPDGGEEQEG